MAPVRRSADAALLGFHYQLDKTLFEILSQESETTRVTVEGVEDIDVESDGQYVAIQCKYLEAQSPTPSAVREALSLMLKEYKKLPLRPWSFVLYAHFGGSSEKALDFSVTGLKAILTHKTGKGTTTKIHRIHEDLSVSDLELEAFSRCFALKHGDSFEIQRKALLALIVKSFSVSSSEASEFIYGKALSLVLELATSPSSSDRVVTKSELIAKIYTASSAFTSPWLVRLMGREKAALFVAKSIKKLKLFTSTKQRTLVIDYASKGGGDALISLGGFIKELVDSSYSHSKSLYDAVPWTIIVDCSTKDLIQVKAYLLDNDVIFNDGYEHVRFTPRIFNENPVATRKATKSAKASDYLGLASFRCRLASLETSGKHLDQLSLGNVLIAVGSVSWQHKFRSNFAISMNIGSEWTRAELLVFLKGNHA
jgi:hypothetical protein